MATKTLKVELIGDTSSLNRALGQTQSNMQKFSRTARIAGVAIFAGLGLAAKAGFDELSQHAAVMAQVEAGIKSTGGAANVTAGHIDELSNSLMQQSGIDDELISQGAAVLLTFRKIQNEVGKNNDIFDQANQAALDLSVRFDKDLKSSALIVGKALNNPTRALSALTRVGVQFTQQQEDQIKALFESGHQLEAQKMILKELQVEVGGSAAALGDTLPGKINIAKESFRDLAGQLTLALLPAFTVIVEKALALSATLAKHPKLAKAMVVALGALAAALITASVAQTILNLAVLANPYVAVAVAVIALGGAIAYLVTKVDFFRKHWQVLLLGLGVFPVLVATVVKFAIRNFDTLKAAFEEVRRVASVVFAAVRGYILSLVSPILTVIGAVRSAIGWFRDLFNTASHTGSAIGAAAANARAATTPHRALGGPVSAGRPFVVGERGPELFVPRSGGRIVPNGGGMTVNLVLDRRVLASVLVDMDNAHRKRNGGRPLFA